MNAIAEETTTVGLHTFRAYDTTSEEGHAVETETLELIAKRDTMPEFIYQKRYLQQLYKLNKFKTREMVVKNIIVTAGRSVVAQRLANTTTYTGIINYGALGSNAGAVANADTQLGTEVFRKVVASASFTSNVAFIDFFYSKADTNGTYQEFGTFIDGSAGANTGQMYTHALTGGWTKLSTESMTVSTQYTLS